jgi:2-polyprenyl-3-methyl-5-hydroxy-6-metoxy-1,4-benzoquinol methylase
MNSEIDIENKNKYYDLNSLVNTYNIDNIYEQYKRFEFLEKLGNYINLTDATLLEFGSATGQMTELLSKRAKKVIAVDGSIEFIRIAKARVQNAKNVKFYESYFENFVLNKKFECLILHHILEHLKTPPLFLSKLSSFLKKDGIIAISVPNAYALSRQLAVKMGLLNSIYDLTENDTQHGHFRVYDWKILEEQITESGFSIIGKHGLSFKLFSDKQNIEMLNAKIIGEEQIKGLWQIADELPDFAGAIMIVARKKKT